MLILLDIHMYIDIYFLGWRSGGAGICFVMQIIVNTFCEFANFISLCNFQRYPTGRGRWPSVSVWPAQMLPIICTHTSTSYRQSRRLHNVQAEWSGIERANSQNCQTGTKQTANVDRRAWQEQNANKTRFMPHWRSKPPRKQKSRITPNPHWARLIGKIGWFTGHICS